MPSRNDWTNIASSRILWPIVLCCLWLVRGGVMESPLRSDEKPKNVTAPVSRPELLERFVGEFVEIIPGQAAEEGKPVFPAMFRMGSERADSEMPVHEVTLKYRFAIAKYEVPQNLYEAVMGQNPSRWKGPRNSVEMLTWKEAREFCRKVTQLLRAEKLLNADDEIRLPTEAEWEYCCRAGTTTAYSFGDEATRAGDVGNQASVLNEYGWHTGNAKGNDPPVGALKPNPWGLYDMHGYLWEFVEDSWHDSYQGAPTDGRAWTDGSPKQVVVRGGSWQDHFSRLTSSARRERGVDQREDKIAEAIGLRCVRAKRS
jgi:formylglycine-generating enzyme required for sulfatase activity